MGVKSYMINVAFVPSMMASANKVETDPYSPIWAGAQGRKSGSNQSGTNQIHATLFEFLRNSSLDGKNYFDRKDAPIPQFQQNQFGGSLGGPIKKNKLFLFLNYEGFRSPKVKPSSGPCPLL